MTTSPITTPIGITELLAKARAGHACAVCPITTKKGFLMCSKHWRLVPHVEQLAVYRTWNRFQSLNTPRGSAAIVRSEYFSARDRAIELARAAMPLTNGEPQ